eukprot:m.100438 g.100438  ORF g.100438 m.100438 type:complete len:495 (+) comp15125_c0_seq2:56-1540(+)
MMAQRVLLLIVAVSGISAAVNVTGFVQRNGSVLMLNGQVWRFSGCNAYWLGLDENCQPGNQPDTGGCMAYPSKYRIEDTFDTLHGLGFNAIRSHSLGDSSGTLSAGLALRPNNQTYNYEAFDTIDYAIYQAHTHGIRLVIPFTDNWFFYEGGYHNFAQFHGFNCSYRALTSVVPDESNPCYQFFVNPVVINDFKDYIRVLLTHVNPYTGLSLKDEPAVLAWETGNELHIEGPVFSNWTEHIASYVKEELGAKQLIMDGRNQGTMGIDPTALANPSVDIISEHYYVPWDKAISNILTHGNTTTAANKVFVIGEYGAATNQPGFTAYLSLIESTKQANGQPLVAGDMWWSFFSHGDNYGFVPHGDSYTLHYPSDNALRQSKFDATVNHTYVMQGRPIPQQAAVVSRPAVITATNRSCARGTCTVGIAWRGATLAFRYSLETSTDDVTYTTSCKQCYTDHQTPVTVTLSEEVEYVRVTAYSRDGVQGPTSTSVAIAS